MVVIKWGDRDRGGATIGATGRKDLGSWGELGVAGGSWGALGVSGADVVAWRGGRWEVGGGSAVTSQNGSSWKAWKLGACSLSH